MYEEVTRLAMGPGTEATLAKIQPLASEFAQPLEELYHRWGEDPAIAWRWSFDMHLRLVGLRFSEDTWYIAQVQGRPVSALVLCRSRFCPQLGSIHRVYTAEPYRHRGLASKLLELAIHDFEATGGQGLIATTERYDNPSTFFAKHHFVGLNSARRGTSQLLWRITSGDAPTTFLEQLLAPAAAVMLRSSDRADLPQLLALFNAPDRRIVRHYGLQILGETSVSAEDLFPAFEQQEGDAAVLMGLTAANGALVGWGSIMPHVYPWPNPFYQQHQVLVDCYLASGHLQQAPALLNEMLSHVEALGETSQLLAYVPMESDSLYLAYEQAGFKRVGLIPDAYREPRGSSTDLGIYLSER